MSRFVQHGLGTAAADGQDTLWIHVPLGVALVGLLAQTAQFARRIEGPASRRNHSEHLDTHSPLPHTKSGARSMETK